MTFSTGSLDIKKPKLSVIITAHNEQRYIARCLNSIVAAAAYAEINSEIVVVLNRCTDQTESIARSYGASCVVEDRKCLAAIRNAGVRASSGHVVVTIDADSWMSLHALAEVLHFLESGRYVGGGCLILPERWSLGIVFSLLAIAPYVLWRGVSGGMFWLKRDTFGELGGFDESLLSVEDLDFAIRLKRYGRSRGLRYGTLMRSYITTSCGKFDQFGDWYLFLNPRLVKAIFSGRNRKAADSFYYEIKR